jgi:two-component system response regulator HydG
MAKPDVTALLVEDERLQSWSLAKSLTKWGFAVRPVYTGRDAMAQIEQSVFDVILLDYQLPDVNGVEVARRIREIRPDAIVFMITAFQLSELPAHAGLIDAYFNKPLDLQQLHQSLKEIPKWHEAAQG